MPRRNGRGQHRHLLSGGDTAIRKTRDIGQGRVKDEGDGKGKGCQRSAVKAGVPPVDQHDGKDRPALRVVEGARVTVGQVQQGRIGYCGRIGFGGIADPGQTPGYHTVHRAGKACDGTV